jgi:hypothetical protein
MPDERAYITDFSDGDEEAINHLYNEVFGGHRRLEEWRWKFRDHPFPELTMISKLVRKGRIIGHVGSLPDRFRIGDQLVFGGQIIDYLIHPSFQLGKRITHINQELNTRMKEGFVDRGIAFGYGFPNPLSYPIAMKYLEGAEDVMDVPVWTKWLRPGPLHGAPSREGGSALLRGLYGRCKWYLREWMLPRRHAFDADFVFTPLSSPDPRLDDLWEASAAHVGNAGVRDLRRLSWRFFSKPGKAYTFWLLRCNDTPMAYAVTAVKDEPIRTGYIIDLLFRPEEEVLDSLLTHVMEQMAHQEIDVVKCLAVGHSRLSRALESRGFQQEPEGLKMIAWILTASIDRACFFDPSRWYVTYADLDGT